MSEILVGDLSLTNFKCDVLFELVEKTKRYDLENSFLTACEVTGPQIEVRIYPSKYISRKRGGYLGRYLMGKIDISWNLDIDRIPDNEYNQMVSRMVAQIMNGMHMCSCI